ncbi:MAG: bifunctional diaminohydroxyphosphoribosylaminopyrimidine deaminase/5-amino-6-(5-phosphoribosylamino)uracil reductase RibD, partial [Bacteroidota bacterium]
AEVNASHAVKDKTLLRNATLYVSLEPCSHYGKTPPCSDLIIETGIPTIIIGTTDRNKLVSGRGIEKLKAAGREVIVGVLEDECIAFNRRFFTFHTQKRPYIILKWAQSKDGYLAPTEVVRGANKEGQKKPYWISNAYSRQLTHRWRSEEQAILIGTQTAIDDNPKLDVRDWYGRNPIKIVLDQHNRIPKENYIFGNRSNIMLLSSADLDFKSNVGKQIAQILYEKNISSVIVEGGYRTLKTFIDENLWDETRIFVGPHFLIDGLPAPDFKGNLVSRKTLGNDELLILMNHD